ncbi:MAG: thiamine pyrophosphate-binding protein, partial [Synergistaceae bacterium]|nr:thiamine pyrophosphate-binding protein [Synergistaceae bacterium]
MIKLSDYVFDHIAKLGVKTVFMLPGGGCMHLVESLGANNDLRYICNLHEQAAAIAADAYAQYTNKLGVALVTTGPGGTNAITGVAGAWLDSSPVLIISGQVKTADLSVGRNIRQMGFQEIQIVDLVKPVTKYAALVTDPMSIRYHLEKAIHLAISGRPGPVWVDIPLDIQAAVIDENSLPGFEPNSETTQDEASRAKISEQAGRAIEILNKAKRPVILAGNGIRLAGALDEFKSAINKLNIPTLLTWKAIDYLDERDPLFAGRPGAIGQRGANFTQQNSDAILIIGARLDHGQTGYSHVNFARGAVKIMVDVDRYEIDKMDMPIAEKINADAKMFLSEFVTQLEKVSLADHSEWLSQTQKWKAKYPLITKEHWDRSDHVDLYALVDALSGEMTCDDLLIPGSSGQCSELTMQAFKVKIGQRIFNTEGLGPMGFGLPAAIGGCIASGGRRVICVDGDGGFQMNIQELELLNRFQLPVKVFVLNNQGYGSIRNSQSNYFNRHFVASSPESGLTLPDTCKVASAYNLPTCRINGNDSLRGRIKEIL